MASTPSDSCDEDYYVEYASPRIPTSPVEIESSKRRKTNSSTAGEQLQDESTSHHKDDGSVPHLWTTSQVKTLIQIRTSDAIDRKFRTTKKSHKHIWLSVAKQLQALCINVDALQASTKYARLRREYSRRYIKTNKSGNNKAFLHDWQFYEDLEPSFRTCRQISPDSVESSVPCANPLTTELNPTTGGNTTTEASTPASSEVPSLVFPNRRKKKPLTQDDRDDLAEKRFNALVGELRNTDKLLAEHNAIYKAAAESQSRYYDIKAELAAAQLAAVRSQQQFPQQSYIPNYHQM